MKALILAAGVGSRLQPLTNDIPKALVKLNGKSFLERILNALSSLKIEEFVIVTGCKHKKIEEFTNLRDEKFKLIFNDKYSTSGNAYSFLTAKNYLSGEEFFKIDSDLVFVSEIAQRLLNANGDIRLSVDVKQNMGDEEMKVEVDQNGKIINLSKNIPSDKAWGESIGIEYCTAQGSEILFDELELMMQEGLTDEYYEEAYGRLARKNLNVKAIEVLKEHKWMEIDSIEDLKKAEKIFK